MNYRSEDYVDIKKKIMIDLKLEGIVFPGDDISISTMTMEAKLDTNFIPENIHDYIKRNPNRIKRIVKTQKNKKKRKINEETIDKNIMTQNIINSKNKKGKKKKDKKNSIFLNQVTAIIHVSKKRNGNPISVKIFRNGTLHFTGCQNIDNMLEAAHIICYECSNKRAYITKDDKIKEVKFANNCEKLKIEYLYNFKVDMINSNFSIPFEIDRPKLYGKLKSENFTVSFDSNKHAAVNLSYRKGLTIFIFESGSIIIIVGNNGFKPIVEGYNFIYKYLLENYDIIVKDDELTNSNILLHLLNQNDDICKS
jgi:TATA-box binding protein (TBP) (component of TFIID and TFIIIB)